MSFEEQIMSKDKYMNMFLKSNGGYRVYYRSNIFRNTRDETKRNETFTANSFPSKTFTGYEVDFLVFSGIAYRPAGLFLLLSKGKPFSHLEINFSCTLEALKFWKVRNITRIFPSFSWDIFGHVTRLDACERNGL